MDVLPLVDLTPAAVAAYHELARGIGAACAVIGVNPADIPDEQGEVRGDSLIVWVEVPGLGRMECTIPAGQWAWRDRN